MTLQKTPSRFVVAVLCLGGWVVSSQEDPARALLEQSLDAHGGRARFEAIRDWHIVAERKLGADSEPRREIYEEYMLEEGGLMRTLLIKRIEDSVSVYGHDGRRGFVVLDGNPGNGSEAEAEGYYRAHGEYYLRALPFKWMDPGVRLTKSAPDERYELLRIEAEQGVGRAWTDVWVAAIDKTTHLLHEARLTHHTESWMGPERGVREITYRYSDYRDVEGILFPFRLEYLVGRRKTGENVIQSIELDTGLAKDLFLARTYGRRKGGLQR